MNNLRITVVLSAAVSHSSTGEASALSAPKLDSYSNESMAPKRKRGPSQTDQKASMPVERAEPSQESLTISAPSVSNPIPCLRSGPSPADLIFTNGAGGTLAAPAMINFTTGFSREAPMLSFQGSMNLGSRVKAFKAVVEHQGSARVVALGGRSMGARAAVIAAKEVGRGFEGRLVLVSYPLIGPKGEVRDKILLDLEEGGPEVLFIGGTKDGMMDFRKLEEARKKMKVKTWVVRVQNADHGMNITPKRATQEVGEMTGRIASKWLREPNLFKQDCVLRWDDEEGRAKLEGGVLDPDPTRDKQPAEESSRLERNVRNSGKTVSREETATAQKKTRQPERSKDGRSSRTPRVPKGAKTAGAEGNVVSAHKSSRVKDEVVGRKDAVKMKDGINGTETGLRRSSRRSTGA